MDNCIAEEQYGFRRGGRGTRDAIWLLRTIDEQYIEGGRVTHTVFIDLEKGFYNRVEWGNKEGIHSLSRIYTYNIK